MAQQNQQERERDASYHALPHWVSWVQENLLLSCLILAEAYLLGTLMTLGWVADIQQPDKWGIYNGVGVVLFFLAGATAAGIALKCSVTAAASFKERRYGTALFNFVGVLAFAGCEIWASLSERSTHLRPTPADTGVLQLLGIFSAPISPTVVIVALLLPFATIYYGFSQHRPVVTETVEERAEKHQRQLDEARHLANLRAMKAAARRQQVQALLGQIDPLADDEELQNDSEIPQSGGDNSVDMPDQNTPISGGKSSASGRAKPGQKGIHAVPTGQWTATDLMAYVRSTYGVEMGDDHAVSAMAVMPNKQRLAGVRGNPYAAPKATVKRWADQTYKGQQDTEQTAQLA